MEGVKGRGRCIGGRFGVVPADGSTRESSCVEAWQQARHAQSPYHTCYMCECVRAMRSYGHLG